MDFGGVRFPRAGARGHYQTPLPGLDDPVAARHPQQVVRAIRSSPLSPREGAIGSSPVRKRGVIQPNRTCQSPRMGAIEPRVIINRPAGALAFLETLLSGASRPRSNAHRPSGPHSRRPVLFRPEGPQAFCRGREAPENGPHNRRAPTGRKESRCHTSVRRDPRCVEERGRKPVETGRQTDQEPQRGD